MSGIAMAVEVLRGNRRFEPVAPAIAPKVKFGVSVLPDGDDTEASEQDGTTVHDYVGQAYLLVYRDSRGDETRRRVTVREIRSKEGILSIWAYCHERRAPRLFRVDRVMELVDLESGEILDADAFCRAHAQEDATRAALRELRQEIAVLVFVARCDGHFHEYENAAIVEHVLDRRSYDRKIDIIELTREIGRMRADSYLFENGTVAIGRMGEDRLRQFERAIKRVIDADGIIHETEHLVASNLIELIRDRRMVLDTRHN